MHKIAAVVALGKCMGFTENVRGKQNGRAYIRMIVTPTVFSRDW